MSEQAKLLVVDDDELMRDTLDEMLTEAGFCVRQASGGKEAIELASKEEFDVAIVDLQMPEMDGLETVGRLRECAPSIRPIILTGHGDVRSMGESAEDVADYLRKLDVAQLVPAIQTVLERQPLQEGISEAERAALVSSAGRHNYYELGADKDAAVYWEKSAEAYEKLERWEQAALHYQKVGEILSAKENEHEASRLFAKAAECRRRLRRRLLIVDDDPQLRRTIVEVFEPMRYEVHEAETFDDAIEALKNQRFDAVVLDHTIPNPDGIEGLAVAKRMKAIAPSVAVVGLTGHIDAMGAKLRDEYVAAGAYEVLAKSEIYYEGAVVNTVERAMAAQGDADQLLTFDSPHDAAEFFEEAKRYELAGHNYRQAAVERHDAGDTQAAGNFYQKAAQCLKKAKGRTWFIDHLEALARKCQ